MIGSLDVLCIGRIGKLLLVVLSHLLGSFGEKCVVELHNLLVASVVRS